MECSFDLQCLQLVEIMGYQWAGTIIWGGYFKILLHFSRLKRLTKLTERYKKFFGLPIGVKRTVSQISTW
jgi:hypothetical protein